MLKENLKNVQNNIKKACERVGRKPEEVTLVAVSKMKPLSDIEELLETGQLEYGENYVQELCDKYENISKPVHWHMIGHLQTNKVKYIIDKVELIHSVDSLHLAKQIEKEAVKKGVDAQILVQVNIAQEDTKFGIDGPEVMSLVEEISKFPHVHIRGLMTSAPFVANPEENRCYFKKLHKLFVDIREKNIDNVSMDILSMGMTNDYEVAIEEGATTEEEGYDEEEMEDEEEEPHKPILSLRRKKKDLTESQEDDEDSQSRVIPFHGKEEEGESVKVIRPQTFNEAQIVADFLKEGKTIVVNLEGIEIGQAQRIIDFIGGASFAVDGSLKAISNNIFIVAPGNIEVSGDLRDEIVSEDMLSPELTKF